MQDGVDSYLRLNLCCTVVAVPYCSLIFQSVNVTMFRCFPTIRCEVNFNPTYFLAEIFACVPLWAKLEYSSGRFWMNALEAKK